MATFDNRLRATEEASKWWWLFLVTGIAWLIISLIVFRFDLASVEAIGIMIGGVVIVAGVNEFMAIGVTQGGWKWVHAIHKQAEQGVQTASVPAASSPAEASPTSAPA